MAEIFKNFDRIEDVVFNDIQVISSPLWSGDVNPLQSFFTSSTQQRVAGNYYTNVYDKNPETSTNAAVQFAIAYGHRLGSGSAAIAGSDIPSHTPTRAIYSQYRNILLPPTDTIFTFGGVDSQDIFVIDVARNRYRQKVDPGNWELRMGRGSSGGGWATNYMSFIDGSEANENPNRSEAGRIYNIYSGSAGVKFNDTVYGLFYPDMGLLVFAASTLASALTLTLNTANTNATRNAVLLFNRISGAGYFAARSEEKISCTHYFVRATNREFNYSNNPSFVSGSFGMFAHTSMKGNPSVYITTIGLYDDLNRLVATAKLNQPMLKTFNREVLIKVKLQH